MDGSESPLETTSKEKNSYLVWLIPLGVIIVLIICGIFVWNSSVLGKDLPEKNQPDQPAFVLLETLPSSAASSDAVDGSSANPSLPSAEITPEPGKPVCGGPEQMIILALGVDENAQTDVLRLVRADFVQQNITVLSIPRDIWVPISGFSDYAINEGRINSIYGFGEAYTGRGTGVEMLSNNISENFGVKIDHYGLAYMANFAKLIDSIGGVDLTLETYVDGTASGLPDFPPGDYHFNGDEALAFSRIRAGDTDDYRIDRQSMVVKAALKKMRDTLSITDLATLATQFLLEGSVSTDIPMKSLYSLACLGKGVYGNNMQFVNMPPDLYTSTLTNLGGNIRIPADGADDYIYSVMQGVVPAESE